MQLWTDGACLASNLERRAAGGIGWVIRDGEGQLLDQGSQRLTRTNGGLAEVEAACVGLAACARYSRGRIQLFTDSPEVLHLATTTNKIRKRSRGRHDRLTKALRPFKQVSLKLISREHNCEAHKLARAALNEEDGFLHLAELLLADLKRGNFARVRGWSRSRGVDLGDPPAPDRLETGIQAVERMIDAWRKALAARNKPKAKRCAQLAGAELQVLAGEKTITLETAMERLREVAGR